jgi:hypothetical protein
MYYARDVVYHPLDFGMSGWFVAKFTVVQNLGNNPAPISRKDHAFAALTELCGEGNRYPV